MESDSFSIIRRKGSHRKLCPEFANNTPQLRLVLAVRAFRFLHKRQPLPPREELLSRWRELDAEVTVAFAREKRRKVLFAGTYLQGQVALAYGAWRIGLLNRELQEQYGITRTTVERCLRGMIDVAKDLGFLTGSKTPRRRVKRKKGVRPMAEYNLLRRGRKQRRSATRSMTLQELWSTRWVHRLSPQSERRMKTRQRKAGGALRPNAKTQHYTPGYDTRSFRNWPISRQ